MELKMCNSLIWSKLQTCTYMVARYLQILLLYTCDHSVINKKLVASYNINLITVQQLATIIKGPLNYS